MPPYTLAYPFPAEHLAGEPDLTSVRYVSQATGGIEAPTPAQLFDAGDATTTKRVPMWPWPLYVALALLVLDLLLRRVRLYGATAVPWETVRG